MDIAIAYPARLGDQLASKVIQALTRTGAQIAAALALTPPVRC
jgi:hypothetical protein